MKRKIIIISSILFAFIALGIFNKATSKKSTGDVFAEVKKGVFEITVTNSGELLAEKSLDIYGPDLVQQQQQQQQQQQVVTVQRSGGTTTVRSTGGGGGGGSFAGGGGGGGMQVNMRAMELKIQDMVPEGTIVAAGDYIAQIDRSSYSNTLKDAQDQLRTLETNLEMNILDTAMTLTSLRDEIKNQRFQVEEARITLGQSKFEPPAKIRQAEIALDKAQRSLEQRLRSYELRQARVVSDIRRAKNRLSDQQELVARIEKFLSEFTVRAPAAGMVIYKKERNGSKRKTGSQLSPYDNVLATLPDLSSMLSKVYVNEIEVSKVKPGQKVNISIDAFPSKGYTGKVLSVANIGEQLPNSDAKMFEVNIKLDQSDPTLRPSMTTTNKIIISTYNDAVFIPTECVMAGIDSIPFVYEKHKIKQYIVIGEANEKHVIVEKGLDPGDQVFVISPENSEKFRTAGEELIAITRERNNLKRMENKRLTNVSQLQNTQE
jgi:HlyD family secretion protein